MSDHLWHSSTLQCYVGDDHCPACRFIDSPDSCSREDLLKVIILLDRELAVAEKAERRLVRAMARMKEK